jgi:hypothetical protein
MAELGETTEGQHEEPGTEVVSAAIKQVPAAKPR